MISVYWYTPLMRVEAEKTVVSFRSINYHNFIYLEKFKFHKIKNGTVIKFSLIN